MKASFNSAQTDPEEENRPIVGVICSLRAQDHFRFQMTSNKYALAVIEGAAAVPLLIPSLGAAMHIPTVLDAVDGLVLTGGAANIEPHRYGQVPAPGEDTRDPGRDHVAIELVKGALARQVPLLGICRGIQEMNVALGGTLHQRLHELEGYMDHRRQRARPWDEQLAARQVLALTPGGLLAELAGGETAVVNSLHGQGLDRVAPQLQVEAVAEDGTIEAVTVRDYPGFALGVQWHVEHEVQYHPFYAAILRAFGAAVAERSASKRAADASGTESGGSVTKMVR